MSTAVLSQRLELNSFAGTALKASARFWFVVAVAGQFAFAFSVAAFYGLTALRGNFAAWNKVLTQGYVSGITMSNAALLGHIIFATVISVAGAFQLIPRVRNRFPIFHRWNGRVYLLAAFTQAFTGLYMTFARKGIPGGVAQHMAIASTAVALLVCAGMALRYALLRDFKTHRRWALRLFLVASGSWFFRVGFFLTVALFGPIGFDSTTFSGPLPLFWTFAEYLLPLGVLELYLRAQDHAGALRRMATAAFLFVITLAMTGGIVVVTAGSWAPHIRDAFDSRKSIAQILSATIAGSGVDRGVQQYRELKAGPAGYNFDEDELNNLGYQFLRANKFKDAIRIFQLNVEAYPQSSNVYDSLGEGYMDAGDKSLAIVSYEKSLQLNPKNHNAVRMLEKLNAAPLTQGN